MAVKRAVVVGINDYSVRDPSKKSNLKACVPDAQSFYHMLVDAFLFDAAQTFTYFDLNASRANILRALRYVIRQSEPGDVVCFYYSGHGARVPADGGHGNADKYYETIVPASGDWISDWELFEIGDQLRPSEVNFTIVLDSCHSGGIHESDAVQKTRSLFYAGEFINKMVQFMRTLIPCGVVIPHDSPVCNGNVVNVQALANGMVDLDEDADRTLIQSSKACLLAACKFDELSWEDSALGHGLMTQAFLNLVNQSNFLITYRALHQEIRRLVQELFDKHIKPGLKAGSPTAQTPQLRGQDNRMDENFLGGWTTSVPS